LRARRRVASPPHAAAMATPPITPDAAAMAPAASAASTDGPLAPAAVAAEASSPGGATTSSVPSGGLVSPRRTLASIGRSKSTATAASVTTTATNASSDSGDDVNRRPSERRRRLVNVSVRRKSQASSRAVVPPPHPLAGTVGSPMPSPRPAHLSESGPGLLYSAAHLAFAGGAGAGTVGLGSPGSGPAFGTLTSQGSGGGASLAERIPDLAQWFVRTWHANLFTGWIMVPHHMDPLYVAFLRSAALNQLAPQCGGRLYAVTAEVEPTAHANWRPDANLDLVVDDGSVIPRYLNNAGVMSVAVQASVSRKFDLIGPAVLFLSRHGRILLSWSRPPGDPGQHDDRSWRTDSVTPELIWRRLRRALEEEEGVVLPQAPSLQATTADIFRNTQQSWLGRTLQRARLWLPRASQHDADGRGTGQDDSVERAPPADDAGS